ncbi:MAG: hypothetical protein PHE07_01590 [Bacteroidales bacterium]|nr:hypothetical protein [Bacteroidales bacterium]
MATMTWGKPTISMGVTGENDAYAASLTPFTFKIAEDSTAYTKNAGSAKEKYGEGHELVGRKPVKGTRMLKFTAIIQTLAEMAELKLGTVGTKELPVFTDLMAGYKSIQVDPEEVGMLGLKIPKCSVECSDTYTGADGILVDVECYELTPSNSAVAPHTWYEKEAPSGGE